jgi:uncharacterized protein YidB (DUF937 family)
MGILDSLANIAERHPDTNDQQHASLLQTVMQMFGNHAGISDLMNNANSQGLGHIVQSWIGTGSNQPIAPGQMQGLLGQDRLNELASRAGVPAGIASAALARILPAVIDKVTPHGKLPEAARS